MFEELLNKKFKLADNLSIQFENSDLIRIGTSNDNFYLYHKDLLLLLPDFFDWCPVSKFLETIQEGREDILKILKDLYFAGILQFEEQYNNESLYSKEQYPCSISKSEPVYFNIHNHHLMIKDYYRVNCFKQAIEANVTNNDTVLELGCGSGILTLFAAKTGAKKLYAIEINNDIVETVAKPLAKENGYLDRITFLIENSLNIPENYIEPKANVLISEILGDGIFNENVLAYTIDARDRFLTKDAILLPKGIEVYLFAYEDKNHKNIHSHNFIRHIVQAKSSGINSYYLKYDSSKNKLLSDSAKAVYIDLKIIKEASFCVEGHLNILSPGNLNACCIYFVANLDDNIKLSNSPWSPQISWTQQLFIINPSIEVYIGDKIPFKLSFDKLIDLSLGG